MNKYLKMLFVAISMVLIVTPVYAASSLEEIFGLSATITDGVQKIPDEITVQLNGKDIDFTDAEGNKVEPKILNNRTMVPMRKIFEVLGLNVEWDGETRSINASNEDTKISLQIGNEEAKVENASGEVTELKLDSVPVIVDNRTLVPVRFIAESLDKKVDWDASNRVVIIIDKDIISKTFEKNAPTLYKYFTEEELMMDTYEATGEISGKVKYTDGQRKTNSSTLSVGGNYTIKVNPKAFLFDITCNITGKGELYKAVKEAELEKVTASIVLDIENGDYYIKSELLGKDYKSKWVKFSFSDEEKQELKNALALTNEEQAKNTMEALDKVLETVSLNKYSYKNIKMILDFVCSITDDSHLKLESKAAKSTYTFEVDLIDILELLNIEQEQIDEIKKAFSFTLKTKALLTNHIPVESEMKTSFTYELEDEKIVVSLDVDAKIESTENVTIKIPSGKEVIDAD